MPPSASHASSTRPFRAVLALAGVLVLAPRIVAQSCFETYPMIDVGGRPTQLILADLDHDGDQDLVSGFQSAGTIAVSANDGGGNFAPPVTYPVNGPVRHVVVADFDGDGHKDLLVGKSSIIAFTFFHGNGDGTFAAPTPIGASTGFSPTAIAIGDIDGDADLDFVATGSGPVGVVVYTNMGGGNFSLTASWPTSTFGSPVLADFDGDGDLDLAWTNSSSSVAVYQNDGSGTFLPLTSFASGLNPQSVASGDFDGDGDADIVVANGLGFTFGVVLNQGNGTFAPAVPYGIGYVPVTVQVTDIVGGPALDLVTSVYETGEVIVFEGHGDGTFAPATRVPVRWRSTPFATGDVDGDSDRDLLVASTDTAGVSRVANQGGVFTAPLVLPWTPIANAYVADVAHADLDLDGDEDAIVSMQLVHQILVYENAPGFASPAPTVLAADGDLRGIETGDFDGDGDPDFVVHSAFPSALLVYQNLGAGAFASSTQAFPWSVAQIVSGDFDVDGDVDVLARTTAGLFLLRNSGTGAFAAPVQVVAQSSLQGLAVADIDGDGDLDLAGSMTAQPTVGLYTNNGSGTFAALPNLTVPASGPLAFGDDDQDGDADLFVASGNGDVSILQNFAGGLFASPIVVHAPITPKLILLDDRDGDGDLDATLMQGTAICVLENAGGGTWTAGSRIETPLGADSAMFTDWDGDGDEDLLLGATHDARVVVMQNCRSHAVTFCAGDGSSGACPCGNSGGAGRGCANATTAAGARLGSSGDALLTRDTIVLTCDGLPAGPGIFLQGDGTASVTFGDGILCLAAGIKRLGVVFAPSGAASFPNLDVQSPLHVQGDVQTAGVARFYQFYYRDSDAGFCTPARFNTSNGISLTYAP